MTNNLPPGCTDADIERGYGDESECVGCREYYYHEDAHEVCGVCGFPERDSICDDCVEAHKGRMDCYRDESRVYVEEEDNHPRIQRIVEAVFRYAVDHPESTFAALLRKELGYARPRR